jgi:hypothetical protein
MTHDALLALLQGAKPRFDVVLAVAVMHAARIADRVLDERRADLAATQGARLEALEEYVATLKMRDQAVRR